MGDPGDQPISRLWLAVLVAAKLATMAKMAVATINPVQCMAFSSIAPWDIIESLSRINSAFGSNKLPAEHACR